MWLSNLFGKVKNLDGELATNELRQVRLNICKVCPNRRADFTLFLVKKKGVAQCSICKCALDSKVLWQDEKCPKNKW